MSLPTVAAECVRPRIIFNTIWILFYVCTCTFLIWHYDIMKSLSFFFCTTRLKQPKVCVKPCSCILCNVTCNTKKFNINRKLLFVNSNTCKQQLMTLSFFIQKYVPVKCWQDSIRQFKVYSEENMQKLSCGDGICYHRLTFVKEVTVSRQKEEIQHSCYSYLPRICAESQCSTLLAETTLHCNRHLTELFLYSLKLIQTKHSMT